MIINGYSQLALSCYIHHEDLGDANSHQSANGSSVPKDRLLKTGT